MTGTQFDEITPAVQGTSPRSRSHRRRSGRTISLILVGIVVAALCVGGGYWLANRDGSTSTADQSAASKALTAGLDAQLRGDTATATAKFREVVTLDPGNKLAFYNLGLIEQNQNNLTAAETEYRKAIAIDPAYAPALYNLGIIVADSNADEAIALYRKATEADPSFARAYLNLGLLLFDTGDAIGSAQALTQAVRLDPTLRARIPEAQQPPA